MAGYYERLGDILRDTLDSDDDPFEAWNPHAGKPRQAGNARERTPPPGENRNRSLADVPKELHADFSALDLDPGSSPEECKQKWKQLLKKHHPDLSASGEKDRKARTEKTLRITEAYRRIMHWYATGKPG